MPVIVTAEVPGQTAHGYDGMLSQLEGVIRAAPGFVLHTAHPVDGGWRVIEIWNTKEDADRFFAEFVAPNLPPGIRPKRTTQTLHSFVRA